MHWLLIPSQRPIRLLLGYHYERLLFSLRSIGILSPMSYAQSWIRAPEHPFFPSAYRSLVRISNKLLALPKSSCPANTKSSTSKICIVNGGILVGILQRNRTKRRCLYLYVYLIYFKEFTHINTEAGNSKICRGWCQAEDPRKSLCCNSSPKAAGRILPCLGKVSLLSHSGLQLIWWGPHTL